MFLPAHRSYIDSLVLASVLRDAGLDQPWRLAGENLSFWPLGPIARRSGTIFIRRDFGFDPAYHLALRCHLADLLARSQSLEWYPEAGRSRTGRLRRLRTGLPRILVAAYLDSGAADVHVVPVSIVYDASPDMESVTELDAGAAKQPEGLRALTHYLRAAGTTGPHSAWVSFGEPLSLRELIDEAPTEWSAVRTLTQRVAAGLRDATRVTAESLLALAIPPDPREPCETAVLGEQVLALLDYAATRRIPLCPKTRIEDALEGMIRTRILSLGPTGFTVGEGRQRMLAYHRGVAEHWFLPRAAAELVAAGAVSPNRISRLLAPLDTSGATAAFEQRVEAELTMLADGCAQQPFLLAPRLLGPVFEAYLEAACAAHAADPSTEAPSTEEPSTEEPSAESPPGSAELHEAAITMLAAEGLREPQADETARNAYISELSCLARRHPRAGRSRRRQARADRRCPTLTLASRRSCAVRPARGRRPSSTSTARSSTASRPPRSCAAPVSRRRACWARCWAAGTRSPSCGSWRRTASARNQATERSASPTNWRCARAGACPRPNSPKRRSASSRGTSPRVCVLRCGRSSRRIGGCGTAS